MTIAEWIASTLPTSVNGRVLLETFPDGGTITIAQAELASLLSGISAVPTHAALSTLPIAVAGGWQKYFDDWKSQGLIS